MDFRLSREMPPKSADTLGWVWVGEMSVFETLGCGTGSVPDISVFPAVYSPEGAK